MTRVATGKPAVQEMVVVHRVFRREYRLAPQMVRAVGAGDVARAATVAAHLTELGTMLHHHHTGEDELLWPRLHERVEVGDDVVTRMERQHERAAALLHEVDELLPRWSASADPELAEQLAGRLGELSAALDEHLDEEEREILPLVEQHLTAQEWAELGERGMAGLEKSRMLVLLGHILEEATPAERQMFLGLLPAPARLAYALVGRRRFAREVADLRAGVVPEQRRG